MAQKSTKRMWGFNSNVVPSQEIKAENISKNTRIRWTKEVSTIVMTCFDQNNPQTSKKRI